jgi:hypothetical protein
MDPGDIGGTLSKLGTGSKSSHDIWWGYMTYNTGKRLMPRFRPRGMLAKSATEDLEKHTLGRIPTIYGKLFYLSSLRDRNTGTYRHHGLSGAFGREEAATALRETHERIFREWINLGLSEKYADLTQYLAALEIPRKEAIRHWHQTGVHQACVPPGATGAEKDYYSSDLTAVLAMLSS